MFKNCFTNTLETTIIYNENLETTGCSDTFIITGFLSLSFFVWFQFLFSDISAMWGRDSMNQVLPYIKFSSEDFKLASMIKGLIRR